MKKLLKKNQKIYVVPQNIKGAMSSKIVGTERNVIEFEINEKDLPYYEKNGALEIFTVVDEGMLYFKTKADEIDSKNRTIKAVFDKKSYDLLQRREYTRIDFEKEFTLKDGENDYICSTLDISAGGMKILADLPLSTEKDYTIEFSLESNIPIQCFFRPIRVDEVRLKDKTTKNIISGRFIALKNIDKIAIVQFCFKKQSENTNK